MRTYRLGEEVAKFSGLEPEKGEVTLHLPEHTIKRLSMAAELYGTSIGRIVLILIWIAEDLLEK